MSKFQRSELDAARDELMSHIHRCGVLQAAPDQQEVWLEDTMGYMAERFPALTPEDLAELREIGTRFCSPVIPHGKQHTALTLDDEGQEPSAEGDVAETTSEAETEGPSAEDDAEKQEMAGAM